MGLEEAGPLKEAELPEERRRLHPVGPGEGFDADRQAAPCGIGLAASGAPVFLSGLAASPWPPVAPGIRAR